ncbi:MAG: type IV pilus secretin PilQ, partial [Gammaproteobacteria bacterium]
VLGLTVTPQITPDERIILDVKVTKDRFLPVNGDAPPAIATKQINTQVLLENGETVVIGGIYEQITNDAVDKVPLVGDIPVIGTLFRRKTKENNKRELLIFLTPKIITPALNIH